MMTVLMTKMSPAGTTQEMSVSASLSALSSETVGNRLAAVSSLAAIDERVQALVAAHRNQLAQLVRQAVDRELAALLDAELEHRANGNGAHAAPGPQEAPRAASAPTTRTCKGCGRTLPLARFEKNRHKCRECRRDQYARWKERRAAGQTETPEQPPSPELAAAAAGLRGPRARELALGARRNVDAFDVSPLAP
jgi:hypothetical protein